MPAYNPDDYEPVEVRIEKFWEKYPGGRIETELSSPAANFEQCRYVARVFAERTDEHPIATGYAFEIAGSGPVNRTNHEENCETSAIGRALANAGFAPKGKRPSKQEMQKVERGQSPPAETTRTTASVETMARSQANAPQQPIRVGPGPSSEAQHKMLWGLAKETNPDRVTMTDDRWLHGQMYARFQIAHLADLSKQHASQMITWFKNGDFIDCKWPPQNGRVDPVEADQREAFGMPQEPAHLQAAMVGNDKYTR